MRQEHADMHLRFVPRLSFLPGTGEQFNRRYGATDQSGKAAIAEYVAAFLVFPRIYQRVDRASLLHHHRVNRIEPTTVCRGAYQSSLPSEILSSCFVSEIRHGNRNVELAVLRIELADIIYWTQRQQGSRCMVIWYRYSPKAMLSDLPVVPLSCVPSTLQTTDI